MNTSYNEIALQKQSTWINQQLCDASLNYLVDV